MKTSTYLWRAIRLRPGLYVGLLALYVIEYCLFMAPPLIAREVFNNLSNDAPARFSIETLLVLLVVAEVAKMISFFAAMAGETIHSNSIYTVMRGNLFARILASARHARFPDRSAKASTCSAMTSKAYSPSSASPTTWSPISASR